MVESFLGVKIAQFVSWCWAHQVSLQIQLSDFAEIMCECVD